MEILPNENRDDRHGETTVSLGMHSQWRMSVLDQSMVENCFKMWTLNMFEPLT